MNQENRDKFLAHARTVIPKEACGLLIIEKGRETLVICKNISAYDQQFIIDPIDFVMAEDRGEVIAVVHSHPMNSPQPSQADKVSCGQTNLKWHIVGALTGDWVTIEPTAYKAPLIGREWCHGLLDCYSLIRDYYKEELNIEIPDYDRDFEWWAKGKNLYEENFKNAGFVEVPFEKIRRHDVILMQILSPVINHGGIYLGGDQFLHHVHNRLSSRDVYGGYWFKHSIKIVRHRSLMNEND
ncbi:MAG: C40 family peptidase [Pseudobdellovibrionaceae bacterium]